MKSYLAVLLVVLSPLILIGQTKAPQAIGTPDYITFSSTNYAVSPWRSNMVVTVTRSAPNNGPEEVRYMTRDGSAHDGQDYIGTTEGRVVFAQGERQKTFTVDILQYPGVGVTREFFVDLTGTAYGGYITRGTTRMQIWGMPSLTVAPNGNNEVVVSWRAGAGEYVLEARGSVGEAWQTVTTGISYVGDSRYVVTNAIRSSAFFRLRQP